MLDFVDLLLRARDLPGPSPGAPGYSVTLTLLFVDEFQDTDPLQAEILCSCAGDPSSATGHASPRPGKLFIVGDPKQSITGSGAPMWRPISR